MKKVIFLDVDGVLNSNDSIDRAPQGMVWFVDPVIVARFNKIFDVLKDVDVVLSSSWRYAVKMRRIDFNQIMRDAGYTGPEITEITPDGEEERGLEIQQWLDRHPSVEKFVIIDDNDDMLHLLPHLIETSFDDNGLKDSHVDKIIGILK